MDRGREPARPAEPREWDEFEEIDAMRTSFEGVLGPPPAGERWIGDDAAVLRVGGGPVLVSVDATVAGVHGDLGWMTPEDFGWKGAATAVSDLAAMGGLASALLVSLVCPPDVRPSAVAAGVAEFADRAGVAVVGGNVSSGGLLVVSVTAIGTTGGVAPLGRDGARAGDAVYVTGPLGAAAAGLRLLTGEGPRPSPAAAGALEAAVRRPVPQLAAGRAAAEAGATAAIDVSDGLAADAARVAAASGLAIDLETVPVAPGASESDALHGGEDYELIVTAPDGVLETIPPGAGGAPRFLRIGRCVTGSGVRLRGEPLAPEGWRHSSGSRRDP